MTELDQRVRALDAERQRPSRDGHTAPATDHTVHELIRHTVHVLASALLPADELPPVSDKARRLYAQRIRREDRP